MLQVNNLHYIIDTYKKVKTYYAEIENRNYFKTLLQLSTS